MRYRIADVCIEVRSDPGVAAGELHRRYGPFEAPDDRPEVVVEVELHPTFRLGRRPRRPYPSVDAHWEEEGGGYRFEREDLSVRLDVSTSPARARGRARDGRSTLDTVLRACLSVLLPRREAVFLHASGVAVDGRAFLFLGPSGAGKSTIVGLTREPVILSDDLVAVSMRGGAAIAHAVPFGGLEAPRSVPATFPVELLCLIEKGDEDVLAPMPGAQRLAGLLRCVVHLPLGDPTTGEVLRIATDLVRAVPVRRLCFRRDGAFWGTLRGIAGRPIESPVRLIGPQPTTRLGGSA